MKDRITGWGITVTLESGMRKTLVDLPEDVAMAVDDFLTELEDEGNV